MLVSCDALNVGEMKDVPRAGIVWLVSRTNVASVRGVVPGCVSLVACDFRVDGSTGWKFHKVAIVGRLVEVTVLWYNTKFERNDTEYRKKMKWYSRTTIHRNSWP